MKLSELLVIALLLGVLVFIVDLTIFVSYLKKANKFPKNEETYQNLLNKEALWGFINLVFVLIQFALVSTNMYFNNWSRKGFRLYAMPMFLSLLVGIFLWLFVIKKKRRAFIHTLTEHPHYNRYRDYGIIDFIEGMFFSFGSAIGALLELIFLKML